MKKFVIVGLALAAGTATAFGQERISVNRLDATCFPCVGGSGTFDIDQAATGSTSIQINTSNALSACTYRIRVYPNPADFITTVKRLAITGGSTCEPFQIILGQSFVINPDVTPNKINANWRGMSLSTSAPNSVFYGGCTGNLINTISGINQLARFDCDGTISGDIFATEGVNGRGAVIRAGNIASSSRIEINRIESINSNFDLQATIVADVITTNISASGSQGQGVIEAERINGPVTFGGALNRVVSTGTDAQVLGQINASMFGSSGSDLTALDAKVLKANAVITTDVRSPIEIREQWEGTTRRISVGRSLDERSDATGTLPVGNRMIILHDTNTSDGQVTNALANQIIINANNNTPTQDLNGDGLITTADFWLGDVSIDFPGQANLGIDRFAPAMDEVLIGPDQPAPHAAPYYKALSHTFGGGAIGLAPFNFHQFTGPAPATRSELDCNPHHAEYLAVGPCGTVAALNQVVIDHYGPVLVEGVGPHYRVEFREAFTAGASWTNVTDQFEVDQSLAADSRKVVIVPISTNSTGFNAAGWFRFRPLAGKVQCDDVNGFPDVVYDSSVTAPDSDNPTGPTYDWYQFRVGLSPCPGESMLFEGDQVNASDLAAWIDSPFEVNMDGQVCSQDFADMSAAYDNQ